MSSIKAGKSRPNVRVEVDRMRFLDGIKNEFSVLVGTTAVGVPALNPTYPESSSATSMISPVQGKTYDEVAPTMDAQRYGVARTRGDGTAYYHAGVDLPIPSGTNLVATASGVVSFVGEMQGYGGTVDILHAGGYLTRYAHMRSFADVEVGKLVHQGEVIGQSGGGLNDPMRGTSTGPHLHFEVREGATMGNWGKHVDPVPYIKDGKPFAQVAEQSPDDRLKRIIRAAKAEADRIGFDHKFLLAICRHETQLGTLGQGTPANGDFILGYGVNAGASRDKYKGIETQMYYGAQWFSRAMGSQKTIETWDDVAKFHDAPHLGEGLYWTTFEERLGWINSVYAVYNEMKASSQQWEADIQVSGHNPNHVHELLTDVTEDIILGGSFENMSGVPSSYVQDPSMRWRISRLEGVNVLGCESNSTGTHFIMRAFTLSHTGVVRFQYRTSFGEAGSSFKVGVNGNTSLSTTESTEGEFKTYSLFLPAGSYNLRLTLGKTSQEHASIFIKDLNIAQYIPKHGSLEYQMSSVVKVEVFGRPTDTAYILHEPNGEVFLEVNGGDRLEYLETVGSWYKVGTDAGVGFISNAIADVVTDSDLVYRTYEVGTGEFVYDGTVSLDNIISVESDFKYEIRAAQATITISNINGVFSPNFAPSKFPELGVYLKGYTDLLTENSPIRIYLGYGDRLPRKFTGLVESVDLSADNKTLTIQCADMMKRANDYYTFSEIMYPKTEMLNYAWSTSAVITDLAITTGLTGWRARWEDIGIPDIVVEEAYYSDTRPEVGMVVKLDEVLNEELVPISSLSEENFYKNMNVLMSLFLPPGSNMGETLTELCEQIGFWHRCDYYGTFRANAVSRLLDTGMEDIDRQWFVSDRQNILSLSKTIDDSKIRNHLIIVGGNGTGHFFNTDLFYATKCIRKTMQIELPWADTYGKKKFAADKTFADVKRLARTLQVVVEGNPYIDLFDVVFVENSDTMTKGNYVVKGVKDTYTEGQGYTSSLDLFWVKGD